MSETIESPPLARIILTDDIPCHQCDYNLRGLDSEGKCPECGGSIAAAIEEHRRGISPATLRRARLALLLMLGAIAMSLIAPTKVFWRDPPREASNWINVISI